MPGGIRFLIAVPLRDWDNKLQLGDVIHEEEEKPKPVQEYENLIRITELRQVGPSSILVKWTKLSPIKVDGYQIVLNGRMKAKVLSGTRTSTVIDSVGLEDSHILIFPIYNRHRCIPPASAKFKLSRDY